MSMSWFPMPDLQGQCVTLRHLKRSDREELTSALADQVDNPWTIVPSDRNFDRWFGQLEIEEEAQRNWTYAICGSDGMICGTTSLLRIAQKHRRVEIGRTVVATIAQRTAVNTECKSLLLHHAFESLGCNVVQFRTDCLNATSRKAIERLGATLEGVLRAHLIMPDGHLRDSAIYSIAKSEWPAVRALLSKKGCLPLR